MLNYIPFLKLKDGEISAVAYADEKDTMSVFFELPRNDKYTSITLKAKIARCYKRLKKHYFDQGGYAFIDNYEVPDSITIDGSDSYRFLLECFEGVRITPIAGIDRSDSHNTIACDFANRHKCSLGIRVTQDYFDSLSANIPDYTTIFEKINDRNSIVLILDCRTITEELLVRMNDGVTSFLMEFGRTFPVNTVIVTGSSIPIITNSYVRVRSEALIERNEIHIFETLKSLFPTYNIICGDYAVVSAEYSELDILPKYLYNVMTARLIYSTFYKHFAVRGQAIKQFGFDQYRGLARIIISKQFYRGQHYSYGDDYLFQKANGIGANCTPAACIGPLVNAHIIFMRRKCNGA